MTTHMANIIVRDTSPGQSGNGCSPKHNHWCVVGCSLQLQRAFSFSWQGVFADWHIVISNLITVVMLRSRPLEKKLSQFGFSLLRYFSCFYCVFFKLVVRIKRTCVLVSTIVKNGEPHEAQWWSGQMLQMFLARSHNGYPSDDCHYIAAIPTG